MITGFKKTVETLDDRTLLIQTVSGEVIKNGDIKCVYGEGMPTYRNPFEKGKLIIQFSVQFPDRLEPKLAESLAKILPPKEEAMIPDDHDEVLKSHTFFNSVPVCCTGCYRATMVKTSC